MEELGKLNSLKKLCLGDYVFGGIYPHLVCGAGFPVLQYLKVGDYAVRSLCVEKGDMPKLLYLNVGQNTQFDLASELHHVTVAHGKR